MTETMPFVKELNRLAGLEEGEPIPGQVDINGNTHSGTQLTLDVGGKQPTKAILTVSTKIAVDGDLRKGQLVHGEFTAVIDSVVVKDKTDPATGIVTEAVAQFGARVTDIEVR